jgi:hypothetical protein
MNRLKIFSVLLLVLTLSTGPSCKKDPLISKYLTRSIVIVVVDGARYSETWGDNQRQYIHQRSTNLAPLGSICLKMYNDGTTSTNPGHLAITRGVYESIDNSGLQYPYQPSFMQYWLKQSGQPSDKAWIITSKDKLQVLADCIDPAWQGKYNPRTDCGTSGLGSGYRNDSTTFRRTIEVLKQYRPHLVLVNFKEPDASGHAGNWNNYLQGIIDTDNYCKQIWDFLQNDEFYKGSTTMIVTNDHGRHLTGNLDGFVSHGDSCEGCRHIECLALGPDIAASRADTVRHSQVDIAATVAELLGVKMENISGKPMKEILK